MIDGKQIHELIDKYLIIPSDLGKEIGREDYEAMATEINLLTEFPSDRTALKKIMEDLANEAHKSCTLSDDAKAGVVWALQGILSRADL